ncbi:MAG: hypothetical protein P4L40_05400 [Terracidiphilus sp.]|nr:hypothetical protein [Terracidiphilus sp.]
MYVPIVQGELVESGDHASLMRLSGRYAKLVEAQEVRAVETAVKQQLQ